MKAESCFLAVNSVNPVGFTAKRLRLRRQECLFHGNAVWHLNKDKTKIPGESGCITTISKMFIFTWSTRKNVYLRFYSDEELK